MSGFLSKQVTKNLLAALPERVQKILTGRYGLDKNGERRTLEAIGKEYNITRERVRQIESHGLSLLRSSDAYKAHKKEFDELEKMVRDLGGIVAEQTLLEELPINRADKNHAYFLLVVGEPFNYSKEDDQFEKRWHIDPALAGQVHTALEALHGAIDPENLIPEDEFMEHFNTCLVGAGGKKQPKDVMKRWLSISKLVGRNPLGEWGRADSPHVRVKSMRDLAYLTLKRHGSPMHFTEVAKAIRELFKRDAHPATCHNELIKDNRFVLVGRGLYALKEWGYNPGVVKDVITTVLEAAGEPLAREDIIERVKRERYVKDATIIVNLQDGSFRRISDGKYTLK
ncbi:MAG: sigma factor-like helix-turn-helix DNA-binding protein [Patescibacteria group bacterium]